MDFFFAIPVSTDCSRIVSTVTGVNNDGVEVFAILADIMRPHDGIDELDKVNRMEEVAVSFLQDREGEEEFNPIDPSALLAIDEKNFSTVSVEVNFFESDFIFNTSIIQVSILFCIDILSVFRFCWVCAFKI